MAQSLFLNICKVQSRTLLPVIKSANMCPSISLTQPVRMLHGKTKKIRFYVLHKYVEYLKNYNKILERKFPGAMQVYRVFTVGVKDLMKDLKDFVRIVRLLYSSNTDKFQNLRRKEIELYHQMPKDMRKIAPVLIISALPLANYVIFPLAYLFPRHLLTSHFWTLQQKSEFNIMCLKDRLKHNRPVFRCVQAELDSVKGHELYEPWKGILAMLGSGVQPSVEQILECKELFVGKPYNLCYLRGRHLKLLLKMHDMHSGFFWSRRSRLVDRAVILKEMDKAIVREGGAHNLPIDAMKNACFIRGLNPANMRNEDMISWLNKWITISTAVDDESLSLLLHSPILLAYNEPSNWTLIYPVK